jgi:triacylglycerol lipase
MQERRSSTDTDRESLERRIRAAGPVLDMALAQSLYQPLHAAQRRDGVDVIRDVPYGPDARQRLDIYMPPRSSLPWATMAFAPGGGFIRGDKSERENLGYYFARAGVLVVLANYRLAPLHRWPSGAEDIAAVYKWSRQHIGAHGGDPSTLFLAGESAGAAHVAAASLIKRFHPAEGLKVAGTMLISGVYNCVLEKLARQQFGVATPDPRNEAYFGSEFDRYPGMSTIALMDTVPAAPLWMSYAELDPLQFQVQAGELFARLVTEQRFNPELAVIRGHGHLTQGMAINTGDESLSGPLLEFMRRCLKEAS